MPIIDTGAQIGIYVHIPFCQKHCPYCDFAVVEGMLHIAPTYVDALCEEIRQGAERHAPNPPVATIFLGGGTPSLLPAAQIGRILATIGEVFAVQPDAEITLEANPGPLRPRHLAGFRAAGVTRLSLGVQTFNPRGLATLGRLHTPEDGTGGDRDARAAGFASVSADLIFGWEDQTLDDWRDDLQNGDRAPTGPCLRLRAHRRGGDAARPRGRRGDHPRRGRRPLRGYVPRGGRTADRARAISTTKPRTMPGPAIAPATTAATG